MSRITTLCSSHAVGVMAPKALKRRLYVGCRKRSLWWTESGKKFYDKFNKKLTKKTTKK